MKSIEATRALAALAQDTRLDAFRLLVQAGPQGLPAGHIAEALDVPPATLSFHLAHLANAGLVASTRHGRSIVYRADYDAMNVLMGYLTENCCGGDASCAPPACIPAPASPPRKKATAS